MSHVFDTPPENANYNIQPETLKEWYEQHKPFQIIDTRNDYEVALGTFENAVVLPLKHFRDFPEVIAQQESFNTMKESNLPTVIFCTGGVRCEKALSVMKEQGFSQLYQLEGGILNYFKKCGQDHFAGKCFVFDDRGAVTAAEMV